MTGFSSVALPAAAVEQREKFEQFRKVKMNPQARVKYPTDKNVTKGTETDPRIPTFKTCPVGR